MTKPQTPQPQAGTNEIARARALAIRLLDELEAMCTHRSALEQLAVAMVNPEGNSTELEATIQASLRQVASLPTRIDAMHKLAETLKTLGMLDMSKTGRQ
jgi:hypothetical protein